MRKRPNPALGVSSARPSYAGIGTAGYLLYTLGAVGPYLRSQLALSDAEVGLHSTALAVGLVLAGALVANLATHHGEFAVRSAGLGALFIALPALALAPSLVVTLASATLIGLGAGSILGYSNAKLGAPGGTLARLRLARSGVWGIVGALIGPVVVAAGAGAGPGWWLCLLPGLGLLAVLARDVRSGQCHETAGSLGVEPGRLPKPFWLAWSFLAASVAVEFSIVFWGATLVERRTGVSLPTASAIASLFIGGMLVGRLGLSLGLGARHEIRRSVGAGLALAAIGTSLTWVSTAPILSVVGMVVSGLGVAILYPLGVAAALAAAPRQPAQAGNRLTMASGLAILVAPFGLRRSPVRPA
jgi:MFS family permease